MCDYESPDDSSSSDNDDNFDCESMFSDSSLDSVPDDETFDAVDDDNLDNSGETLIVRFVNYSLYFVMLQCFFLENVKRIVDLKFIFEQIKEMNTHSDTCNFNDMKLIEHQPETKYGLIRVYNLMCSKCGYISKLRTYDKSGPHLNLNYAAVLGSLSIGIGFSQLQEFTGESMSHFYFFYCQYHPCSYSWNTMYESDVIYQRRKTISF